MARLSSSVELPETPAELPGQSAEIRPSRPSPTYAPFPRTRARIQGVHQQQQHAHQNLLVRHELDATSNTLEPYIRKSEHQSSLNHRFYEEAAHPKSDHPSIFKRIRAALQKSAQSSPKHEEAPEEPRESGHSTEDQQSTSIFRSAFYFIKQRIFKRQSRRRGASGVSTHPDSRLSPDVQPSRSQELRPPSPIPSLSPVSTMRYEMLEEDAVGFTVRPWSSRPASRTDHLRAHTPSSWRIGQRKGHAARISQLRFDTSSPEPPTRRGRPTSKVVPIKQEAQKETRPQVGPKRMSIGTMLASQLEEFEELRRSHNWEAVTEDESETTFLSSTPVPSSTPLPSSTPPSSPPDRVAWFGARSKPSKRVVEESPLSMSELEPSQRLPGADWSSESSMHSSMRRLRPKPRPKTIAVDRHSQLAALSNQGWSEGSHMDSKDAPNTKSIDFEPTHRSSARASVASFRPARKQLGALFKELESARRDARRIEAAIAKARMKEEMERPEVPEKISSNRRGR